ncbi:hypothetical protein HZC31_05595 [Candidatus Woesearchaeota archaeon]|nr:hypothetical protein [Candidatus Woesearchaeota archaeon]
MNGSTVNLEHLAYDGANFAHSEREPTSMSPLIKGPRPFFYQWTKDEGMEILVFEDPTKPDTAKLFRYNKKQIYGGVDLENDTPAVVGDQVVEVLKEYASR